MNKNYLFTFIYLFVFIFTACNEKDNIFPDEDNGDFDQITAYTFTYKDVQYTSIYKMIDGEMIIEDDEVRAVLDEINKNPNSAQLVSEGIDITFYDSHDDLCKALGVLEKDDLQTRTMPECWTVSYAKFWMYENKNYGNCFQTHELSPATRTSYWVPHMPNGYDKKMDSFSIKITAERTTYDKNAPHSPPAIIYLYLYEEENYKGKSITFRFSAHDGDTESHVPDLSKYALGTGSNWSKKTSSYLFFIQMGGMILLP